MDSVALRHVCFLVVPFSPVSIISSMHHAHLFIYHQCCIILEIDSMVNVIKKCTLCLDLGGPCVVPSVGPFSLIVE
jgi:hypothetical protein